MQFPISWLQSFFPTALPAAADLAELLTMAGLEVEESRAVAPAFDGVVVAQILRVAPHPNAERLQVCEVAAGAAGSLRIVCGAANARAGLKAPLALLGAHLPGMEIRAAKIRGEASAGMLCSAAELGLSEEAREVLGDDGKGLLELPDSLPVGQDVRAALQLDDTLLTLKLTPNLAHHLSLLGLAREVCALTGLVMQAPRNTPAPAPLSDTIAIEIAEDAKTLCGRFTGRVLRGVNAQALTPHWMRQRLWRCAQRPVSALVDISNYVMFELGQPTHIFDLAAITGGIQARWGRPGETLKLLNEQSVTLDTTLGVVADARGALALAGIMGGAASAVSDNTRDVFVESAFWHPQAIAGRARRVNVTSDAAHRFERGVDFQLAQTALERVTNLLLEISGGQAGPIRQALGTLPQRAPVFLRPERAARVTALPVTAEQCEAVCTQLGMNVQREGHTLRVTPPSWRFDINIEEDLIEEVLRIRGYAQLPQRPVLGHLLAAANPEGRRTRHALRHQMAALGYQESIHYSFVAAEWDAQLVRADAPAALPLANPMTQEHNAMRRQLLGGLLQTLRLNTERSRPISVRLFEIGRVFLERGAGDAIAGLSQPVHIAGLAWGARIPLGAQWRSAAERGAMDFFDVKGDIETLLGAESLRFVPLADHPALHPGRAASIFYRQQFAGILGELHPRLTQQMELPGAPLLFELDEAVIAPSAVPQAPEHLPRQQSVWRDLSLLVPEALTHEALMAAVPRSINGLTARASLFDLYRAPATSAAGAAAREKSMAIRLQWRDQQGQPLTEERVTAVMQSVLATLQRECGARLREA